MPSSDYYIQPSDPASFRPDQLASIRHNYEGHPMLQLDSLEQLATRLMPSGGCRFVLPGIAADSEFDHQDRPHDGSSIADVFKRIAEPESWIALYRIQQDPEYREFLEGVRQQIQVVVGPKERIFDMQGFIFISAPPSITPFHIDRENNFWLQVRGRKKLHLWDRHDSSVVREADVEGFIVERGLENVKLNDEIQAKSLPFDCGPGDGMYFPSTTPHMTESTTDWVTPENGVTISVGMVFYTAVTRREAQVHSLNRVLRRLGAQPTVPGVSAKKDSIKAPLGKAVCQLRRKLRGYKPPPGII